VIASRIVESSWR